MISPTFRNFAQPVPLDDSVLTPPDGALIENPLAPKSVFVSSKTSAVNVLPPPVPLTDFTSDISYSVVAVMIKPCDTPFIIICSPFTNLPEVSDKVSVAELETSVFSIPLAPDLEPSISAGAFRDIALLIVIDVSVTISYKNNSYTDELLV